MEETKTYFTLRYCHSDNQHKVGERIAASTNEVRIGQQEDCDIKLANDTDYADETFAIVRQSNDGEGWNLITCSENIKTIVNGTDIKLIHRLNDGDHITFSESSQELLFNVHTDDGYNPTLGTVHIAAPISIKLMTAVAVVLFVLIGVVAAYTYHKNTEEDTRMVTLNNVRPSVLQLTVSTVYLQQIVGQDTTTIDSFTYDNGGVCGTAFITKDSLLVTARHCIEPWLNDGTNIDIDNPRQIKSKPTQWALMAETYRQTHSNDTLYKVVSVCSLYSGDKGEVLVGSYRSDQFCYDDSRDDIIEKGDFDHEYYWRSLRRRHSQTDMMLGDVACIKVNNAGNIIIADSMKMAELVKMKQRLCFIGYPAYSEQGKEMADGEVKLPYKNENGDEEMIAHNGMLTHGYSGGPALVVEGNNVYVVGVVSVTDNVGDRMYSVPITQIKRGGNKR